MAAGGGKKAVVAALLANAGIAVAKFVAFLFTRSASMLAESIHSVADAGNQGLLLFGTARANRPPDETHPFGYGRVRYFWAFIVAIVLFLLGAVFAIYEGVEKLRHPHDISKPGVAIGVLVVAVALETWSFRTAIHEARPLLRGRGWWQFIRESRSPELPVVLLEDLGALVGLLLALAGVTLTVLTGNVVFDALGTLSIGVLLGVIAIVLAIELKGMLIGEAAAPEDVDAIKAALVGAPGFTRVIHLRTLHLGPDDVLVAAKVAAEPVTTLEQLARAINDAEARVRAAVPLATTIVIEPDVYRA